MTLQVAGIEAARHWVIADANRPPERV